MHMWGALHLRVAKERKKMAAQLFLSSADDDDDDDEDDDAEEGNEQEKVSSHFDFVVVCNYSKPVPLLLGRGGSWKFTVGVGDARGC